MSRYAEMALQGQIRFGAPACLAEAVVELGLRKLPEGRRKLRTAIQGLALSDQQRLPPVALALGAYAAALAGDKEAAGECLDRLQRTRYAARAQLRPITAGYAAAARYLVGGGGAALRELHRAAEKAAEMGWTSTEMDLRLLAVRVGDLAAVELLLKVSARAEGAAGAGLNKFARAMLEADAGSLQSLHHQAPNGRFLALAIDSLKRSRLLAENTAAAQDLAARLLPELERGAAQLRGGSLRAAAAAGPSSARTPHSVKLTRRELDIANLVAQGKRNAQIARELSVSVRTVEGHIYRAFSKLGINRREDLTAALLPGCAAPALSSRPDCRRLLST
ncbi:helix-turn-helix transcriptional regulator [Arthrobacter deserti]|uniref:Helix-turn-helix transcriptional regulator n=1 Tax=Arthrobacter deserti TaxID=1742687 RepID=A0ABX1JKG5_9MICC|nr:helix-turn-helix transcriptional regulator [Arthrobacter deserti]